MLPSRKTILMLLVLGTFMASGCNSKPNPAPMTIAAGQAQSDVPHGVTLVAERSRKVLTDMTLSVVQYRLDAQQAMLVAYTPATQRVEVDIRREGDHTRIIVRSQDNERLSAGILAAIHESL